MNRNGFSRTKFRFARRAWLLAILATWIAPAASAVTVQLTSSDDINRALTVAEPGDVFELAPGTYRQNVVIERSGGLDAPIILRARQPGTVVLSGTPSETLVFTRVSDDLYRAPVDHRVRWVLVDDRNLVAYETLDDLRQFHDSARSIGGPPEGFAWEDGFLYLRLANSQDPGSATVEIHREYSGNDAETGQADFWRDVGRAGGVGLQINGHYVVVGGIRFRLSPEVGIRLDDDTHHITVEDCHFIGVHRGIMAGAADLVTVRRCEFSGYPGYEWFRWSKYVQKNANIWKFWQNTNLMCVFLHHWGSGVVVENCLVYGAWDAFWPRGGDGGFPSEYRFNAVISSVDEHIEYDTHWYAPQHLRVHHNYFMDAQASQALSPVLGGHVTIDHNIVYFSPEKSLNSYIFKLDIPGGFRRRFLPDRDITIAHNTFACGRGRLIWSGQGRFWSYANCLFENNLFSCGNTGTVWDLGTESRGENVAVPWTPTSFNLVGGTADLDSLKVGDSQKAADLGFVQAQGIQEWKGDTAPIAPLNPDLTVAVIPGARFPVADFHLTAASPAVDAGRPSTAAITDHPITGTAPDCGALELGRRWIMPRTGPAWAVGDLTPLRPPLPASCAPAWLGLDAACPAPDRRPFFPYGAGDVATSILLTFEAEDPVHHLPTFSPWAVRRDDPDASSRGYVSPSNPDPDKAIDDEEPGNLCFRLTLAESASLFFWMRIKAPGGGANSYFFKVDGIHGTGGYWDLVDLPLGDWTWVRWRPTALTLKAGTYGLAVGYRESDVCLDKILITNDWSLRPE